VVSPVGRRLLQLAAIVAFVALLSGCVGGGGGSGGPGPAAVSTRTPTLTPTAQTTGEPCPDDLHQALDAKGSAGLVSAYVDPTTFSGPAGYESILAGLPLSCDLLTNHTINYSYFYGQDESLVAELVKRLEAAGFTPVGGNTAAGGYWVAPDGTAVSMVYSPDGQDTEVPGQTEGVPLVGTGTARPWVAIAFL
jgi:hypothetical protein